MKKIFKEAHKMTKEIASKYDVDYQAQFGLCLAYLLNKEEEKEMIKLYEIDGELFFADTKTDKVYEIGFGNELVEQYDTVIDDWFDIEDAKEVKMEDYYNVEY